jgi:hypothetical protein
LFPYFIGSSDPVFSPDGKYLYIASAANDLMTFSAAGDMYKKKRELKKVLDGMYRADIETGKIDFIAPMALDRQTASSVVITNDGKILYFTDKHAVFGMQLETGDIFLLCGSRDTFGKANGRGEDARLVTSITPM